MNVIIYTIILITTLHFYRKWTTYRTFKAAAAQNGCKRPQKYPHKDPFWGSDLMRERMKAVKEGRQMALFMEHFKTFGKTWQENFLGTTVYNTMDVRNIQQVSALSFDDYGKPAQNFFRPFLGNGILSLHGPAVS
jgi:hypothetical protein